MKKTKFLIIGGTGKTGRKVVESLRVLNQEVRVGSRGAEIPFDWDNPKTWDDALNGIDKMYITFQPDLAVPGAKDAIEALVNLAKTKGVQKVVLLSGKGEQEAERCEAVIMNSGLDYTIVRANWFMQNFSESFLLDPIVQGVVALPMYQYKVPYVDTGDIADVVVESLLHEEHNGKIYQLTGPEGYTFPEVVELIAERTGREIEFVPISLEDYVKVLNSMDLPEGYSWLLEYLFSHIITNLSNEEITDDIELVLKRKPRSFSDFATEMAHSGIWNATATISE